MGVRIRYTGDEVIATAMRTKADTDYVFTPGMVVDVHALEAQNLLRVDPRFERVPADDVMYAAAAPPRERRVFKRKFGEPVVRTVGAVESAVRLRALAGFEMRGPSAGLIDFIVDEGQEFDLPKTEADSFMKSVPGMFEVVEAD